MTMEGVWKRVFIQAFYSSTSRILAFILDFPPLDSPIVFWQTRQLIFVEDFPNNICSFLHLGHLTLMNFDDGSLGSLILTPVDTLFILLEIILLEIYLIFI